VSGAGTIGDPVTLEAAIARVQPGGAILLRGGGYRFDSQVTVARGNDGGADEALRKRLWAFVLPDGTPEIPVLDFSEQPYGDASSGANLRGVFLGGHWWHLRGIDVAGAADNGIYVAGNYNLIEACRTYRCRDSGLQISRHGASAGPDEWPSFNLVLNCESWDNYDGPPNNGENADGFACKLTSGEGNVFRGCVAHHNIDDGWDLFARDDTGPIGSVVIDRCVSYANGTLTDGTSSDAGDRNGFKLGGSAIPVVHTVTRSVAFGNGKNGFTWNSNPAAIRVVNNLAFDNVEGNFKFDAAGPLFHNNVSLYIVGEGENDRYGGPSGARTGPTNCFWFTGSSSRGPSINDAGLSASAAGFISLSVPPGGFARGPDGGLAFGGFGRPAPGSPLVGAGVVPSGLELPFDPAYYLGAPDLGAVEVRGGFELWREEQFGEGALASARTAAAASPARDGYPNLFKYLLGLGAGARIDPTLLPSVAVGSDGSSVFRWLQADSAEDVTATPQSSPGLADWEPLVARPVSSANGFEVWESSLPGPATRARVFRLSLSQEGE
jgi:hypothetical protein